MREIYFSVCIVKDFVCVKRQKKAGLTFLQSGCKHLYFTAGLLLSAQYTNNWFVLVAGNLRCVI